MEALLVDQRIFLYSDNHALQFINNQPKLNQNHAKWVDFLKGFTFVIKCTSGNSKKFVDALSRVNLIMQVLHNIFSLSLQSPSHTLEDHFCD